VTTLNNTTVTRIGNWLLWLAIFVASLAASHNANAQACTQTITADVVVFDSPTVFNRLGAQNPNWITYTLRRDAIYMNRGNPDDPQNGMPLTLVSKDPSLLVGNVELRPDKRPRPLVLRSVAGACLDIKFQNFLDPQPNPNKNRPIRVQQLIEERFLDKGFNCADPNADQILADLTASGATGLDERFACALVNDDQVAGRCAGIHAQGVELRGAMKDDGSLVGNNHPMADIDPMGVCSPLAGVSTDPVGGLVAPGGNITYELFTPAEGAFIINSYGAQLGSEASSGNTALGMFGALNVQPKGARMYRSQVTEEELRLATSGYAPSDCAAAGKDGHLYDDPTTAVDETEDNKLPLAGETVGVTCSAGGQPIINYEAIYPVTIEPSVWNAEDKAGRPILNMLQGPGCDTADWTSCDLVHSDINAIIAGPDADGSWTSACASGNADSPASDCPYPLESVGKNNPQLPNRIGAFREFTSVFHDEQTNSQVTGIPEVVQRPRARLHAGRRQGPVHDQLRLRRYRVRDHRESPAYRTDARLHGLRLRRILPVVLDSRRPGAAREYAGQLRYRAVRPVELRAGRQLLARRREPRQRANPGQLRVVPGGPVERAPCVYG
jgi:hypothetical protein